MGIHLVPSEKNAPGISHLGITLRLAGRPRSHASNGHQPLFGDRDLHF
jgi:hypothetical protein